MEVREGEFVSVMGPSGCGKSTLLNIMGMLDAPTKGKVVFDGMEIDYLKEARLGDRLRIRTWAHTKKRSSLILAQVMLRDDDPGVVLARALVTAVWVGTDRRPMRLPREVIEAFRVGPAQAAT